MMRKVRLPLAILDKPDTPIAVPALRRLLEMSAAESGAEDFGLRLAERGGLTNFGAVGLIVREQATVGEAIEAFSRFIHVHHDGMKLDVVRDKQTVTVTLYLRGRQPTASRQSIDMALGSVHRIIQSLFELTGGRRRCICTTRRHTTASVTATSSAAASSSTRRRTRSCCRRTT